MLSLLLDFAYAAAGGAQSNDIPWKIVITQIGNYTIFVLLLAFLLKNKIKDYFQAKKEGFETALKKAEQAKFDAEQKQKIVLEHIEKIEKSFDESIQQAKVQAEKARIALIEEAKATARSIKRESEKTYQNQLQQAVLNLRAELLEESAKSAEELIRAKMQKQDHENLQDHLVKSFGATK